MIEYNEKSKKELFFERKLKYDIFSKVYLLCRPIKPAAGKFNNEGEKQKSPRRLYNRLKGVVSDLKRGEIFGYRIVIDSPLPGLKEGVYSNKKGESNLDYLISELEKKYGLKKPVGVETA